MGWTPRETRRQTVSDFWLAWSGWCDFQGGYKPPPMDREQLDALIRQHGLNG